MISDGNLIADDRDKGKGDEAVAVEEQGSGRTNRFGRKPPPKAPNPSQMTFAIKGILKDCGPAGMQALTGFPDKLFEGKDDKLSAKACKKLIENWRGNAIDFRTAREGATTMEEVYASVWYEMYLGLKGDLGPNWRPSCDSQSFKRFQSKFRPFDPQDRERSEQNRTRRFGDLDDMVRIFRDILIRDPKAREAAQNSLDHILVDECVHEDTLIQTRTGRKPIKEVEPGEEILSFDNGTVVYKTVRDKRQSNKNSGVTITTKSGRTLSMTVDHRLYATSFNSSNIPPGQLALYLMYREGMGFRIGTSSDPTGRRPVMERADRLWVLEVGEKQDILLKEQVYSLRWQIPTYIFEGAVRGCDQQRINTVFSEFGANGRKLLTEAGLSYEHPHWYNTTHEGYNRKVLSLRAHRMGKNGGSTLSMSWTGDDNNQKIGRHTSVYETSSGRFILNKRLKSYAKIRAIAFSLAKEGFFLAEDLEIKGVCCPLTTAGALRVGMKIPTHVQGVCNFKHTKGMSHQALRSLAAEIGVELHETERDLEVIYDRIRQYQVDTGLDALPSRDDSQLELDEIVHIDTSEGTFIDISVEDSGNFFANGLLSHNCQDLNVVQHEIFTMLSEKYDKEGKDGRSLWFVGDDKQAIYQFRGARPSLFSALDGKEGWTKRLIQTNYRCEPEIVDGANKIAANNGGQIPMQCRADPRKKPGKASVNVIAPGDYIDGAFEVLDGFSRTMSITGDKASQFAVLSRNNAELDAFEDQCILREIPYRRSKGSGFLDSNESRVVLGYMDLALSSDMQELQEAFVNAITKPDRGMFLSREAVEKIVRDAYKEAAHDEGIDSRSFNPLDFLTRRQTAKKLAYMLKAPQKQMWIAIAQRSKTQGGGRGYNRSNDDDLWLFDKKVDEMTDQLMEMGNQIVAIRQAVKAGRSTLDTLNSILDTVKVETGYLNRRTGEDTRKITTLREQIRADISFNRDPEEDGTSDEEKKVVLDDSGKPVEDPEETSKPDAEEEDPLKGLGTVRYLFQLAEPNDKDKAIGLDPSNGRDFYRKIDRYKQIAKELQDPEKFPDRLTLSTTHSVKGAQWNHVALCMSHGFFPGLGKDEADALSAELQRLGLKDPRDPAKHAEAATKLRSINEDPMTADRNLAYVGVTRAKENLTIVCSQERVPPKMAEGGPRLGKFVYEAGWHVGENVIPPAVPVVTDPHVAPVIVEPAPTAVAPASPADIEPDPPSEPGVSIEDVHLAAFVDDNTALEFVDVALAAAEWAEDT
jgi:superfamily I DNA/RNA helicase